MSDKKKFALLFRHLYFMLTTPQIQSAIRSAGLEHRDWLELVEYMKFEKQKEASADENSTND